jgi:hypothetical protein
MLCPWVSDRSCLPKGRIFGKKLPFHCIGTRWLQWFLFDTMSDFAQILALCRARIITIPTIHMGIAYSGSVVFIFQRHTSRQKSKPKLCPISPKIQTKIPSVLFWGAHTSESWHIIPFLAKNTNNKMIGSGLFVTKITSKTFGAPYIWIIHRIKNCIPNLTQRSPAPAPAVEMEV